jgi:hypothetical protein
MPGKSRTMRRLSGLSIIASILVLTGANQLPRAGDGPPKVETPRQQPDRSRQQPDQPKQAPRQSDKRQRDTIAATFADSPEPKLPLHMTRLAATTKGLELAPATQTVPPSKRVVVVSVKASVPVGWFVTNDPKNPPVEWFELPGQPFVLVFPNNVDEVISVHAFATVDDKPIMVRASVRVSKEAPTTPQTKVDEEPTTPTPPRPDEIKPLPPGSRLHVTVIMDKNARNDKTIITDLATVLKSRNHWAWTLYNVDDDAIIRTKGFDAYMSKIGKLPIYIIQDEKGLVLDFRPLPGTAADVLAVVDKYAPPK